MAADDADALHAEWAPGGRGGDRRTSSTPGFGVWEAAHTDPDGNLLRFGSPSPGPRGPCLAPGRP